MLKTHIKNFAALALVILTVSSVALAGPYAPAAGQAGSTAIHMDDASFVAWATGYVNYNVGSYTDATWQTPGNALGQATGRADDNSYNIVSLGRGGDITLTFDMVISNGAGYDFAVFENGFFLEGSDTMAFLELGFVEVSSDGTNFFRFDNDSKTSSTVGSQDLVDTTNITGYCSKYAQGYGTPFDLADLAGVSPLLNINAVTHVKIVDIIGDGTYTDSSGDVIYDPFPTIGSAGVDLDAIGVINHAPEPTTLGLCLVSGFSLIMRWRGRRG